MKRAASLRSVVAAGLAINLVAGNLGPVPVSASSKLTHALLAIANVPPQIALGLETARRKLNELRGIRPPRSVQLAPQMGHLQGVRFSGLQTLRRPVHSKHASLDPQAMSATYRQLHGISLPAPAPTVRPFLQNRSVQSVPSVAKPGAAGGLAPTGVRRAMTVNPASANYTGINHYWTYEVDTIPGVGKYMVNVGPGGNLVVQADDMSISHKGVALAYRRTYNSLSQHDYFGTDGSQISNYGAGWTSTFDAHLATNTGNQNGAGLSVYDVDGARYDYLSDGQGHWIPPAGQYATLTCDGIPPNQCGNGYFWTKKTGTVYYFWKPNLGSSQAGLQGRLIAISGRNNNTQLNFSFAFANGDASCACNLTDLYVTEEDGRYAHLAFSDVTVNSQPQRLLNSLIWPDGTVVAYSYDTNGNLAEVDEPPNSTYWTSCHGGMARCLPEWYVYNAPSYAPGYALMSFAEGPRWVMSSQGYTEQAGPAGGGVGFTYATGNGNALVGVGDFGYMNPTPPDGSNTPIQPALTTAAGTYRYVNLSRNYSTTTQWSDSDGHSVTYTYDASGRVTQTAEWTGSLTLTTTQGWDAQDNLISSTDARGNETDYAYDSNGNTIAEAQPQISMSVGTFRPTDLYSYDGNNNILAHCDPMRTNQLGLNWTSRPAPNDSLCPSQSGATILTWTNINSTAYEPFGELTRVADATGFGRNVVYSSGPQGGEDYGLPTSVTTDSFTQADGSSMQIQQTFSYDQYGDAVCLFNGEGTSIFGYDGLSRIISVSDPDDSTSGCGRTPGSYSTMRYRTYYTDGAVQYEESARQRALSPSASPYQYANSYQYDADGNKTQSTTNNGNLPGVTTNYYDGAERLVEVAQPFDSRYDYHPYAWLTRYLYDLTSGGTVSLSQSPPFTPAVATGSFKTYGNLFDTQEWIDLGWTLNDSGPRWTDYKGTAYDALDRQTSTYNLTLSGSPQMTNIYDGTQTTLGYLFSTQKITGESITKNFLQNGLLSAVTFSGDGGVTPSRTYQYDADGRAAGITSAGLGTQSYQYDADGRVTAATEPAVAGGSTISYAYAGNGWREQLSVSGALNETLFKYIYRSDGKVSSQLVNANGWRTFAWTYTTGGRLLQRSDPTTGIAIRKGQYDTNYPSSTFLPQSYSLDSFGAEQNVTYASGQSVTGITHDAEDNPSSDYPNSPAQCSSTSSGPILYGLRAEMILLWNGCSPLPNYAWTPCQAYSHPANGYLAPATDWNFTPQYCGGGIGLFDPLDGFVYGSYGYGINSSNGTGCGGGSYLINSRDLGGRSNSFATDSESGYSTQGQDPTDAMSSGTIQYDAEDHTIGRSSTYTNYDYCGETSQYSYNTGLAWGPNGHPISYWGTDAYNNTPSGVVNGSSSNPVYLHWDGGQLLFTSSSNGVADIKIGSIGDITPDGSVFVMDRSRDGTILAEHSNVPSSTQQYNIEVFGCFSWTSSPCITVDVPTTDSLTFLGGENTNIQGVRATDDDSGLWTTPDALSGVPGDPMSQKPYVFVRNNPMTYSDPSGFCSDPGSAGVGVCIDFFIHAASVGGVLRGDNRSFTSDALKGQDSYRVQVNLDFSNQHASNILASNTFLLGTDAGKGHDQGSTITWDGDTATVHVSNRCGACPQDLSPAIHGDFTVSLNDNGSVSINGAGGLFPSLEAYAYKRGRAKAIVQQRELPGDFGFMGIYGTGNVQGKSNPQ